MVWLAWVVALLWAVRTVEAAWGLRRVPDLLGAGFDRVPEGMPRVTVVVPARDEAAGIVECLESLLAQDYAHLQVIAVNDRSTDGTGALMEKMAARAPERMTVMHVAELPAGWLGKTHAMALGAKQAMVLTQPEFFLFTDADVVFRADALRRTLVRAVETRADHMVTMPTVRVRRWDEGVVLGFFQILGMWATRLWRAEDPKAVRDAVGVGAFNLVRRSAYVGLGGFEAQKMAVVEDIVLARRVKKAGLRQTVAFGRGLVEVHWAAGATGLVGVMTKNIFAVFGYYPALVLFACGWLAVFGVGPALGIWWGPVRVPSAIALGCVVLAYRLYGPRLGVSAWYALGFPFGAVVFIYTLLRSMGVTLWQGGVMWRGTFYSLEELRRESGPLR